MKEIAAHHKKILLKGLKFIRAKLDAEFIQNFENLSNLTNIDVSPRCKFYIRV